MNWQRVDRYAQRSACGKYSVAAIGFYDGQAGFWEAWRTRAHRDGPHLVATNLPSAEQAREICRQDSLEGE